MKYISICSGIEAASTAWHGLGWTPLAFSEIEPFPSAVLAHHYPTVPNLGDMSKYREWPKELLAECDLLVGGSPCQAFSVAGLRKSLDDERGNLTLTYVHLFHHINEVRKRHGRPPAIAVWENVPGVLSTKDNAFGCFVSGLLGVDDTLETQDGKWPKAGFLGSETVRVGYRILDAQYFAVAQRRRRVFLVAVPCELVASLGERACPSEILSLRESVLGNPPTRGEARQAVARGAAERAASGGGCGELPDTVGTLSDGAHMGGGLTGRTPTAVAYSPSVANTLTRRMHKGINTTVDEGQTPIVTAGGAFSEAVAFKPGQSEAAGGTFVTNEFAPTIQSQNNGSTAVPAVAYTNPPSIGFNWQNGGGYGNANDGLGITEEGTGPLSRSQVPACVTVGFSAKDSGADATEECSPTMRAMQHVDGNANAGGQIAVAYGVDTYNQTVSDVAIPLRVGNAKDSLTAAMVPFTKSKRAQSVNDDESWVPGEVAPTQNQFDVGDTRATTVVAFAPLQGGRSMPVTPESPTLEAGTGNKAPAVLAFAQNQAGEVRTNDGVMGTVNTNQNASGRNTPMVAFNAYQRTEGEATWPIGASDGRKVEVGVRQAMQVRRLTPTECCRLQGFPDAHCDITFRKKPAADGPKYRALGNSMAVPCMAWIGYRIHMATVQENK